MNRAEARSASSPSFARSSGSQSASVAARPDQRRSQAAEVVRSPPATGSTAPSPMVAPTRTRETGSSTGSRSRSSTLDMGSTRPPASSSERTVVKCTAGPSPRRSSSAITRRSWPSTTW